MSVNYQELIANANPAIVQLLTIFLAPPELPSEWPTAEMTVEELDAEGSRAYGLAWRTLQTIEEVQELLKDEPDDVKETFRPVLEKVMDFQEKADRLHEIYEAAMDGTFPMTK